ncbi:hypothetical protein ACP275_02G026800 [Erythranthe tilingii]
MELRCMQAPTVSSIPRSVLLEKPFSFGHTIVKFPCCNNRSFSPFAARRLKFLDFRARKSETSKIKSQAQDAATASSNGTQKDENLVFVAGATGKVGSRTVRCYVELLKLGFKVRAGVRSIQRAESLVQSVQNMKLEDLTGGAQSTDKFELVECDLENLDRIKPALGNSSIVICCIGASEKEIFDISGPYRIDFQATKNLIDAATSAKVEHFILLTSLGTNKIGFPAAILNLFWGVLIWKRKAEEVLLASGLPYTIVRPGGMERPTDSYKETHNITLSEEDTLFGGQVSNLQVAELMAFMAKNRSLSYCKVVEVIAETTAPLTPAGELLKTIPSQREEVYSFKESDAAEVSKPIAPDSKEEPEQVKKPELVKKPETTSSSSPYSAYEDLKPPTSPTPTPSTGSDSTIVSKTEITPSETISTSSSIEVDSSETATISTNDVIPQIPPKKTNPSSPYINYEDLKPPTSPTPTPSISSASKEATNINITPSENSSTSSSAEVDSLEKPIIAIKEDVKLESPPKKAHASSPYINYEDLKPPTSPTPTASGSKKEPSITEASTQEVSSTSEESTDSEKNETISVAASVQSPYLAYDDLKPPSSPSPSVPAFPEDNKPENPVTEEPKSTPLSPYTMYEDLKPPSSPVFSPK